MAEADVDAALNKMLALLGTGQPPDRPAREFGTPVPTVPTWTGIVSDRAHEASNDLSRQRQALIDAHADVTPLIARAMQVATDARNRLEAIRAHWQTDRQSCAPVAGTPSGKATLLHLGQLRLGEGAATVHAAQTEYAELASAVHRITGRLPKPDPQQGGVQLADFKQAPGDPSNPDTPGDGAVVPLGSGSPKDSNKPGWTVGDPRHLPWVAGPNGPRPPQGPGAPRWVEMGPGSGTYVRADEIPGSVVKAPGELGPSPFYDGSGNPVIYVELGPNTGVWAPITNFPGAHFPPPHTFGPPGTSEYIPGSGVWVPRDSLIREPLAPLPVPPATVHSDAPS